MNRPLQMKWWSALGLVCLTLMGAYFTHNRAQRSGLVLTFGDVVAVHGNVKLSSREVDGEARIREGDVVQTNTDGRARVRLDDGTIVAADGATAFQVASGKLVLRSGRIFVQGGSRAKTVVELGQMQTVMSASAAAFEIDGQAGAVYCAQGELVLTSLGKQSRIESGDTASFREGSLQIAPEKAFEDWTGGLAVPWAPSAISKSAIPQVRTVDSGAEVGTDLVLRAHEVDVNLDGELALTRSRTTYFNGGASTSHARVHLALPPGAILKNVVRRRGLVESRASVEIAAGPSRTVEGSWSGLEWAGGGYLLGDLGALGGGETMTLELEYAEWLQVRGSTATYRFPMESGEEIGPVGELRVGVDAVNARSSFLRASAGATARGDLVSFAHADVRPSADFVVELAPEVIQVGEARAYVAPGGAGGDPYVLVRTEVPPLPSTGVTLALVLDTSMSIGPAILETERSVVDALLTGLGPTDSVVVLAADQRVRAVGPPLPAPVTPELRALLRKELGSLTSGGASNLGTALEHAADLLDAPERGDAAGTGMIVYIGDGRATVGATEPGELRELLARRAGGLPSIGAIAVGAGADVWTLAKLVVGVGAVFEAEDSAAGARASAQLLVAAQKPTVRQVQVDLGPSIDRIYPREAQAFVAGTTMSVVGRLRGKLPDTIGFRFRSGSRLVEERRALKAIALPAGQDVAQRWAAARIEEIAARGEGIEPAITLAYEAKLLSPYTSWFFEAPQEQQASAPFSARVLDLSASRDTPYVSSIVTLLPMGATLLEPGRARYGGVSLKDASVIATLRVLGGARSAIRACRDARAATRRDLGRRFVLDLKVDAQGHAASVKVDLGVGSDGASSRDAVLERCIEGVVRSLPYFVGGAIVNLRHEMTIPEDRAARRTACSPASKVALPLRKSIWRARGPLTDQSYLLAAAGCELSRWRERREYLLLAFEIPGSMLPLPLSTLLAEAGEDDAAEFLRKEALRRVSSFAELTRMIAEIRSDEPAIEGELESAYAAAIGDEARLSVVRRFLRLAPHNTLAKRRLLHLLDVLKKKPDLLLEIDSIRQGSVADAGLLADAASLLRKLGRAEDAERAFGELVERAPGDPWTLSYVGDRLRAEGMFEEALFAYESLERLAPGDAGVVFRLALAQAGAGRLDVATRRLERVAQTGGSADEGRLGELAAIAQAVLVAEAQGKGSPAAEAELHRRLLQTPLPDVEGVLLIRGQDVGAGLAVRVIRGDDERELESVDLQAPALGLSAVRLEHGEGAVRLSFADAGLPGPRVSTKVLLSALKISHERRAIELVQHEVVVAPSDDALIVKWDGETFQ